MSLSVLSRTLNIPSERRRRKENEEKGEGKQESFGIHDSQGRIYAPLVGGTCELISPKRITSLNRADSCLVAIHFTFVRKGEPSVTLLPCFVDCHCIDSIYYHVAFTFERLTFSNDPWDGFEILFFLMGRDFVIEKYKIFWKFFFFGSKCVWFRIEGFLLDKFFWNFLWKWTKFYCGIILELECS